MKLTALVLLCACSAAFADHHGSHESHGHHSVEENVQELAHGLSYLYRRFLRFADPDQIALQDSQDVQWRNGMLASPPYHSKDHVTLDGEEHLSLSSIQSIVSPELKGSDNTGDWFKNNASELIASHNFGGPVRVHLIDHEGHLSSVLVGNPLREEGAHFNVFIPRSTYSCFESLSAKHFTYFTYIAVPEYLEDHTVEYSAKEMEALFPQHTELFERLSHPGLEDHDHDDDDDDDDDHDDDHHGHHGGRRGRRGRRGGRRRKHH